MAGANPYVGPKPLSTDNPIFGRDREIRELVYLLTAERIVVLHSPSGAGKSSLIQAKGGLVDQLLRRFDVWLPTRVNLPPPEGIAVANRYSWSAAAGFEQELPEERRRSPESIATLDLKAYVAGRPRRPGAPKSTVLIFDQFEEIVRIEPLNVAEKRVFFEQLGDLLLDPLVWALFVLREDYLALLDPYSRLIPTHLHNRYRIDLLKVEEAKRAIENTASEGGREFAEPALARLLDDLATVHIQQPDGRVERQRGLYIEPLQLQVVCRNLWEQMRPDDNRVDLEDVEAFGNVTKALSSYYDLSLEKIGGGDHAVEWSLRDWVGGRLITPDGLRGQVQRSSGASAGLDNRLIQQLVDTHLVRAEQRAGSVWFELAHDRLVEPVQNSNREWLESKLHPVEKRARLWEQEGRPDSLLYVDQELTSAAGWVSENPKSRSRVEKFLAACRAQQSGIDKQRTARRALRVALAAAVGALAVAVWFYVQARDSLQEAVARRVFFSQAALSDEPQNITVRALLSLESVRLWPTIESVQALQDVASLLTKQVAEFKVDVEGKKLGSLPRVELSPGGKLMAVLGDSVRIVELESKREIASVKLTASSALFSPDARLLCLIVWPEFADDGTARVHIVDVQSGQILRKVSAWRASFHPNGKWVAVHDAGAADILNIDTGKSTGLRVGEGVIGIQDVKFNGDGSLLALEAWDQQSEKSSIVLFRITGGARPTAIRIAEVPITGRLLAAAFHHPGGWIAAATSEKALTLTRLDDEIEGPALEGGKVTGANFSADATHAAYYRHAAFESRARVYDTRTARQVADIGLEGEITDVSIESSQKLIAVASNDGYVRVFQFDQPDTRKPVRMNAQTMAISAGAIVLTGTGQGLCYSPAGHQGEPICASGFGVGLGAAISPNGAWGLYTVMADGGAALRILDLKRGTAGPPIAISGDGEGVMLSIDSSAQRFVVSQEDTVRVLDRSSGALTSIASGVEDHHPHITGVALSPDATRLAVVYENHLRLFSIPDGKPLESRKLPNRGNQVAYSPNGRWITVGIEEQGAIVADANTLQTHREIALASPLQAIGFDESNRYLQTVHNLDGLSIFQQYAVDVAELKRTVCDRVPRNLSTAEWRKYIGAVRYNKTCADRPVPSQ